MGALLLGILVTAVLVCIVCLIVVRVLKLLIFSGFGVTMTQVHVYMNESQEYPRMWRGMVGSNSPGALSLLTLNPDMGAAVSVAHILLRS